MPKGIPYGRDEDFVGREAIFQQVKAKFETHRRLALIGLGGVGKSQIAIEYAYRFLDDFPQASVFWVHASTGARFIQAYHNIALQIDLKAKHDPKADISQLVLEWLDDTNAGNRRWLMILDNVDDTEVFRGCEKTPIPTCDHSTCPNPLSRYLPISSNGSIIITTRNKQAAMELTKGGESTIEVLPFGKPEAKDLLVKKLTEDNSPETVLEELVEALGCLPHAITQAAAFINVRRPRMTPSLCLELLQGSDSQSTDVLGNDMEDTRRDLEPANSLISTWQVSFDQIKRRNPASTDLLALVSVLDGHCIPDYLLSGHFNSRVGFEHALAPLLDFLFVSMVKEGSDIKVHFLVQLATRKWLESNGQLDEWKSTALSLVAKLYPEAKFETRNMCKNLSPHVQLVLQYSGLETQRAELLNKVAEFDQSEFQLDMAFGKASEALDIQKRLLGESHLDTLQSYQTLSSILCKRRKYKEAMKYCHVALTGRQTVLGSEHCSTIQSMALTALIYKRLGKIAEATEMEDSALEACKRFHGEQAIETFELIRQVSETYQEKGLYGEAERLRVQVVEGTTRLRGPDHPSTLNSLLDLAAMHGIRGRYKEMERLTSEVLEAQRRVLGQDDPSTFLTTCTLANSYSEQGRWKDAGSLYQEVLEKSQVICGQEHPTTLSAKSSLALVFIDQGCWDVAESLMLEVLDARKKHLGEDHDDTVQSKQHLAVLSDLHGKLSTAESETLLKESHEWTLRRYGSDHPATFGSMMNLGVLYEKQGNLQAAEQITSRAVEGFKNVFGCDHPTTLSSMGNLARYRSELGFIQQSMDIASEVLNGRKRILGPEHPDTLVSERALAVGHLNQGNREQGARIALAALEIEMKVLGEEHPQTLESKALCATIRAEQGHLSEAEQELNQSLVLHRKIFGLEHPRTLNAMTELSHVYRMQEKHKEAQRLVSQAFKVQKRILGAENPETQHSMSALVSIYIQRHKFDAAERLNAELLRIQEKSLGVDSTRTQSTKTDQSRIRAIQTRIEEARTELVSSFESIGVTNLGFENATYDQLKRFWDLLEEEIGRDEEPS
ncbi:hypothetical protein V8E54_009733 [Elaphomyces granulatus]